MLLSRKFLIAVVGLIMGFLTNYTQLPAEVQGAIYTLLLAMVGAIVAEDFARNFGGKPLDVDHNTLLKVFISIGKTRQFKLAMAGLLAVLLTYYSGLPADIINLTGALFSAAVIGDGVERAGTHLQSP